jgi:hypothetical protein
MAQRTESAAGERAPGQLLPVHPATADMVVSNGKNWLFGGIVAGGQKLPGLVGNEYAQIDLDVPSPRPIEALFWCT